MDIFSYFASLGLEIKNKEVLLEAFTHSSYINENRSVKHHNERLEFLGDAVLQIWVSERLYKLVPELTEGKMSALRQQLVCEKTLADLLRELEVNQYIRLGVGEEKNGGRHRDSLLADCFEAMLAALYLNGGFEYVDVVLNKVLLPLIKHPEATGVFDYKSKLQEYVQSDIRKAVQYRLISESGPANEKIFESGVYLDEVLLGKGKGTSKQRSEQEAAKKALEILVK